MTTPSRPIGPQRFGLTLTTLGLALPALFSGASARAQGYTVPSYVFSSVAMDYPAAAPNSTAYSLQATAGQTFATIDQPTNTGQTLAALGFFETGVKYLYTGHVALENFTGNVSTVPLDLRFWNNIDNSLSDEVQGFALSNGNFTVATWANPTFNAGLSLKGDRWLRQRVAPTPPVNPATDYPSIPSPASISWEATPTTTTP